MAAKKWLQTHVWELFDPPGSTKYPLVVGSVQPWSESLTTASIAIGELLVADGRGCEAHGCQPSWCSFGNIFMNVCWQYMECKVLTRRMGFAMGFA